VILSAIASIRIGTLVLVYARSDIKYILFNIRNKIDVNEVRSIYRGIWGEGERERDRS
jgi:hypothetical protein